MIKLVGSFLSSQNKFRAVFYSVIIGNILIWSFLFSLPDGNLHLKIYDVGQGDAIFLRTPGGYKVLIDGGPNNTILDYLGEELPFYSKKIDLLILTHPQSDHLTGLVEVVKRYQIDNLWISGTSNKTRLFSEWQELLQKRNIPTTVVKQRDLMVFPDKTQISVMWPKSALLVSDINAYSVVVLVSYGNFDALLTGDADKQVQPYTSDSGHVEVFKVPHHGSKNSVDLNYLQTISPDVSVISVGSKNSYGHPSPGVVNLLENLGSKVYRTDKNGTTEIVSDGKSWYTKTN
ncbi:MAG TPA: MBL fold metallo-hydrolase [Candidatus Nanoarchaeia archaeon]